MPKANIQPGEIFKGFRVKLYPTQEQLNYLAVAQVELMKMWNILVTTWETYTDYCVRHCEDSGLIEPLPERPTVEHIANDPDLSTEWAEYGRRCRERRRAALQRCRAIDGRTRRDWANLAADFHGVKLTEKGRLRAEIDYRVLMSAIPSDAATARMAQAMTETYRSSLRAGRPPPQIKKRSTRMPLLLRTGPDLIQLSKHGERVTASGKTRLTGSHRCLVHFGPLEIKGRFHRHPPGPLVQGVAISLEQDGWYAGAKVKCMPTQLATPTREIIAINPGLEYLYADSEGNVIENPRGNAYSLRVRELSEWIDAAETAWDESYRRNQLGRYQERFARHVRDIIHSQVLPRLAQYQTILIGKTGKAAAQGPQTRISSNDEGGYTSAMWLLQEAIIQKYALYEEHSIPTGRVLLVSSEGISRRCSQCGTEHATRYQRNNTRRRDQQINCAEPSCQAIMHVDVNAARNLLVQFLSLRKLSEAS